MKKPVTGMSTIDLMVILLLFVISALGFFWGIKTIGADNTLLGSAILIGASFIILMPIWLYNDRRDKMQLKEEYEQGKVDRDYYIYIVGEKFFRKHHGDEE